MQDEPKVLATLPVHSHKDDTTRTHMLRVDGLVGRCLEMTVADLEGLPQQDLTDDFTCLEGWTVPNLKWRGVALQTVLSLEQPSPEAHYVQASAGDFSVPLPRDHAERALLAIRLGENAVPPEHGARFVSLFRVANVSRP